MSLLLRNIAIAVPSGSLLEDFQLDVAKGEVVTLMGPSGCGKSLLLGYLTGHVSRGVTASGGIFLDDRPIMDLAPEQRRLGILFQDDLLFPHMNLGENLMFGVPRHVRGRPARQERAEQALGWAQLDGLFERDAATLSGGQRKRAALMRALLAEPRAMLLDEPFTELDEALRQDMRAFTFHHLCARGIPTILVTHDPADAEAAGGRIVRPWTGAAERRVG